MIEQESNISVKVDEISSQITLNYDKALKSMKQVTEIRKITQQALSPVVRKIQEHIGYLLQETNKMRIQTKSMQELSATNKQYKKQIDNLNQRLTFTNQELHSIHKDQLIVNSQYNKKILDLEFSNDELKKANDEKEQKIKKIVNITQRQNQLFELTKKNTKDNIQIINQQIEQFYNKCIQTNQQVTTQILHFSQQLKKHEQLINFLEEQSLKNRKITTLYTNEREEIRNHLYQLIQLKNFVILREEYENDRKIQKFQNQMNKKQIQKMLNTALTPQIRAFLPILIESLSMLKKLDHQMIICNKEIQILKINSSQNQNKIIKLQTENKKQFEQKKLQIQNISILLQKRIYEIQLQLEKKQRSTTELFKKIENIQKETKYKFQTFIQVNKAKLYATVSQCKPIEIQEEEKGLKQKMVGIENKIVQMHAQVKQRCENVLNLGINLQSKLQMFQNRITKAKSDLKVQNENIKVVVQRYGLKMSECENKNHEQCEIISKIMQIVMVLNSLMIDTEFLNVPGRQNQANEAYISFHDGFILQINHEHKDLEHQIQYRKKNINKQILKRATLKQTAKLIDYVTENMNTWKWKDPNQRPSKFYTQSIYPSYEMILNDNKSLIQTANTIKEKTLKYKLESPKFLSSKRSKESISVRKSVSKLQQSKEEKRSLIFSSKQQSLIEKGSKAELSQNLYQTIDFKRPNRIQLKRLEPHEKDLQSNKRYSSKKN